MQASDMPSKAWVMLDKWWWTPEFHVQSKHMKNKRLLALENVNVEFVSSQYSAGISKKTKSSFNLVKAAEDLDGIYYSEEESPAEDPVRPFKSFYRKNFLATTCIVYVLCWIYM